MQLCWCHLTIAKHKNYKTEVEEMRTKAGDVILEVIKVIIHIVSKKNK